MSKLLSGKRIYRLPITAAATQQAKEFDLSSDMQQITGIAVTADRRDLVWNRGMIGLTIAGEELIANGEDASEYMFGSNHAARTWAFGELPMDGSDRRMNLRYTDNNVVGTAFAPYTVKVVLTFTKRTIR